MNQNQKTALIIGSVVVVLLVFILLGFLFIWGFRGAGFGMMGPGMMGGYGSMFLVPIFFIVILGLIIWAVVTATQKTNSGAESSLKGSDDPLEILKLRYARGEIDKEEYETKKRDLI
ncbi:MAG: SHOCT domain-containing protein [Bacillota bacterium]|nr:SHOCT domain-containing protein [Bacillota bacterium]MDW7728898.1 SHOCT domain-containing protein [Bacillota bacterium]